VDAGCLTGPKQNQRGAEPSSFPGRNWSGRDRPRRGTGRVSSGPAASASTLARRGEPQGPPAEVPTVELPALDGRPAAVLCVLFDERRQAQVVLTRRSSRLRSHTSQVSFPGGRLDEGEAPLAAALREAREEVGLDPATIDVFGRLSTVHILANPAPIVPFVGGLPGRPLLRPNPAEVERAFTVSLAELSDPDVYREEVWTFPDGSDRRMHLFELVGDTVWGATARMLYELLDVVLADPQLDLP
jgi:8-oxo-dGTP pyrophosphatase MutT (NUDIX family)